MQKILAAMDSDLQLLPGSSTETMARFVSNQNREKGADSSFHFLPQTHKKVFYEDKIMDRDITILIAEDDRGHFILTQNYLRKSGIDNEIIWFPDGQQALDFFRDQNEQHQRAQGRKYILLLDIRMPKIDGIELLERIRQFSNDVCNTPVVIVSTSNAPRTIKRCEELGCIAYIVKPFVKDDTLIEAVNKACLAV
jgi:CheY-like chemotaxis protein